MSPAAQTTQSVHLPAPIGGLNTVAPAGEMPTGDAVYCRNLFASESGMRVRQAYREWCTGLTGGVDSTVPGLVPFIGSIPANNKLFAVTAAGIWDVTDSSAAPPRLVDFAVQTEEAGRVTWHAMSTVAGRFLLLCDEANGYHVWSESGAAWSKIAQGVSPGEVDGFDPNFAAFVTVFKNRIFLVEKNTTRAWYGDVNAIYGTFTAFDFGPRFRAGGELVGLYNWSYDGGGGMNTLLAGISRGGDVVIYEGTDPSDPDAFELKGTWSVGGVPSGRQIATHEGGDVLIASQLGALSLSKLVTNAAASDTSFHATAKIASLVSRLMASYRHLPGWSLVVHPTENALFLTYPTAPGQATSQLAMSFASRGWCEVVGLPIFSMANFGGETYFGTADGRVCWNTGYLDNVLMDGTGGTPVDWGCLPAFEDGGTPRNKRVQMVRVHALAETATPIIEPTARFDFNRTEPDVPAATTDTEGWDGGTWDSTVFGSELTTYSKLYGATGMGRFVSVAIRGTAVGRTTFVGCDIYFDTGGSL